MYEAHDWIDFKFSFIKVLVQAIKHGQSKLRMLKKSESEELPGKIFSHLKKKGKLITIHFQDHTNASSNAGKSPFAKIWEAFKASWDPTIDMLSLSTSNDPCQVLSPALSMEKSVCCANKKCLSSTNDTTNITVGKLIANNEELKKESC